MAARSKQPAPMLEWVAASLGLSLTLATLGFFGWQTIREEDTPPVLQIAVERIVATSAGHVVEIEVRNHAWTTAADVEIEGTLSRQGAAPESSRLAVDFVPAHSVRRAGLHFQGDPRAGRLALRVLGYVEP